jgi:hypothetical protein
VVPATGYDPALRSGRLALYLHACSAAAARGEKIIDSMAIARHAGTNAPQVRRDFLRLFGRSGTRGVGYWVDDLLQAIRTELERNLDLLDDVATAATERAVRISEVAAFIREQVEAERLAGVAS